MADLNLTDRFISELYELSINTFSESNKTRVKNFLLDYLGVTFAGSHLIGEKGYKLLERLQSNGKSSVIGFNKSTSLQSAVFLNGLSSHIAELDDGVISGSVHPGAPLFSALLPVSEIEKSSGEELIKATIIGYEAIVRLANTVQPSHKSKGYHATGTCGAIGTAVGLSVLLGLSKKQMKNAFSSAVISASGTLKAIEDDSELKPFNVGNAALNGLIATSMAQVGFEGPDDVLSGPRGFLTVMSDGFNKSQLFKDKKEPLALEKVYLKPYASCRYCHPSIDATFLIRNKYSISLDKVKEILVRTYQLAVYNHDHITINNISSAKMSLPYSIAVSLKTGKAGISEFSDEYINDPDVANLTKKVTVLSDEEFTSCFPGKSISSVEITTMDGKIINETIEYPKGEPQNPLSEYELIEKFKGLMYYSGKSKWEAESILNAVYNLDDKTQYLHKIL